MVALLLRAATLLGFRDICGLHSSGSEDRREMLTARLSGGGGQVNWREEMGGRRFEIAIHKEK